MIIWDYATVREWPFQDGSGHDIIVEPEQKDHVPREFLAALNHMGGMGWEVITITVEYLGQFHHRERTVFLKRPAGERG